MSLLTQICPEPNEYGKRLAPIGRDAQREELQGIVWGAGRQIASAVMHEVAHEGVSIEEASYRFIRECMKFTADTYTAEVAAEKMEKNIQEMEIPEENR